MSTAAVIVAAGRGERMRGAGSTGLPKQLQTLAGQPVLSYSLEFFERLDSIDRICVVMRPEFFASIEEMRLGAGLSKPLIWAEGGVRRQDSARNGVCALPDDVELVAIHDAARPFPPRDATERAVELAREVGGAIVAAPMTDTVKRGGPGGRVVETLDRWDLWLAQTPQVFRRDWLMEAYDLADRRAVELTDDAAAFELAGRAVAIVPGSSSNLKITMPEDLVRCEALAESLRANEQAPGGEGSA